jgi:hypothetical protein
VLFVVLNSFRLCVFAAAVSFLSLLATRFDLLNLFFVFSMLETSRTFPLSSHAGMLSSESESLYS